jgi:hypothetical protein
MRSSPEARIELLADCEVVYDDMGHQAWSLRTAIRQTTLRRLLKANKIQDALNANPQRPQSAVQTLFESYLIGRAQPLRDIESLEQGQALLQVVGWLEGVSPLPSVPPPTDLVRRRVARLQFLKPLHEQVGPHFTGRNEELSRLDDYTAGSSGQPPLFLCGLSGCGKSALISEFILNNTEPDGSVRIPFAYVDLDRPEFSGDELVSLLIEVMRQLAIQYPVAERHYRQQVDKWGAWLARLEKDPASPGRALKSEELMDDFVRFIDRATPQRTFMLVLDSFHELQFRTEQFLSEVLTLLQSVHTRMRPSKTVLCGRIDICSEQLPLQHVPLDDLDETTAIEFLVRSGISSADIAQSIFERLGGSPRVLRSLAEGLTADPLPPEGAQRALEKRATTSRKAAMTQYHKGNDQAALALMLESATKFQQAGNCQAALDGWRDAAGFQLSLELKEPAKHSLRRALSQLFAITKSRLRDPSNGVVILPPLESLPIRYPDIEGLVQLARRIRGEDASQATHPDKMLATKDMRGFFELCIDCGLQDSFFLALLLNYLVEPEFTRTCYLGIIKHGIAQAIPLLARVTSLIKKNGSDYRDVIRDLLSSGDERALQMVLEAASAFSREAKKYFVPSVLDVIAEHELIPVIEEPLDREFEVSGTDGRVLVAEVSGQSGKYEVRRRDTKELVAKLPRGYEFLYEFEPPKRIEDFEKSLRSVAQLAVVAK